MASRIALTDGSGRWFSPDKAERFKESTRWNGNNHISRATGSQWHHEWLWRTSGGRFVLNCFSDYQSDPETYSEISADEAAVWFSKNELDPHPECAEEFAALEID